MLTGFWHGASWNFLIWGLFHGVFLASEHAGFSSILKQLWRPIQHIYLLSIIIIGWVFFRADTLSQAIDFIHTMFDLSRHHTTFYQFAQVLSHEAVYAFLIGTILSAPVYPLVKKHLQDTCGHDTIRITLSIDIPRLALLSTLLFLSFIKISSSTYNPFIYFRF